MNQHYVPRSYLKNFAVQKRKDFFVDVYDTEQDRYFNANIKNICSEIDLYTLDNDNSIGDDRLIIEKIYSNGFEPLYLKSYPLLTNNNVRWITDMQRIELLIGIFQLYMRNPLWIKNSIEGHAPEIRRLCAEAKSKGIKGITYQREDYSFRDWTEEQIIAKITADVTREFKEKHISGIGEIADFHEHACIEVNVIKDDDDSVFITGDNPIVMSDRVDEHWHPLKRSKEFCLVLNPKMALYLYHDNTKRLNEIYRRYTLNGSVSMFNNSIVKNCSRFVIGPKSQLEKDRSFKSNFMDNCSLELKINMMQQALAKFTPAEISSEIYEHTRYYLDKYDRQGGFSLEEEIEMLTRMKEISRWVVNRRIS